MRRRNFIAGLLAAPLGLVAARLLPEAKERKVCWVRIPRISASSYSGMTATEASDAMSVDIRHFLQVEKLQALGNTVDERKLITLIKETLGSKA